MSSRLFYWRAWLPMRETPDGTIDALIGNPRAYVTKFHAFDVTGAPFADRAVGGGETRVTLCGRTAPQDDDHLGWYAEGDEELRGRCAACEAVERRRIFGVS